MFAELDVRANALQSLANIVEHCFCCGLLLDDSEAKLIVANIEIEMFGDLLGDELVYARTDLVLTFEIAEFNI